MHGRTPLCPDDLRAVLDANALAMPRADEVVYYVARSDLPGLVKIGTTTQLRERLKQLAGPARHGRAVTLLATEPGGKIHETRRHAEFSVYRQHGEWFWYAPALIAHVASLGIRHLA
jgi:hypothetical protein